jgi:hypothetical protein
VPASNCWKHIVLECSGQSGTNAAASGHRIAMRNHTALLPQCVRYGVNVVCIRSPLLFQINVMLSKRPNFGRVKKRRSKHIGLEQHDQLVAEALHNLAISKVYCIADALQQAKMQMDMSPTLSVGHQSPLGPADFNFFLPWWCKSSAASIGAKSF